MRYVLQLPKEANESDFKVELIAGKTVRVDAGNRYFFGGKIEEETIEAGAFHATLSANWGQWRAPDGDRTRCAKGGPFITLAGEPYLIRYNSRLPIVVYAPEGVEIRYRVWRAEPEAKAMKEAAQWLGAPIELLTAESTIKDRTVQNNDSA